MFRSTRRRTRALVAALALLVLALWGCTRRDAGGELGSIILRLQEPAARTLEPEGDFTPASYLVSGSGPEGATFSLELTASGGSVQELAAGSWVVAATGRNAAGDDVASGEGSVEVLAGQSQELAITLAAISGNGTLELTIAWDPALAASPLPAAELVGASGESIDLQPVVAGSGQASSTAAGVPAAWYTLVVRLYDGENLVAGAADAALIRASATTRGSVSFDATPSSGSGAISVTITTMSPSSRRIVMAGQLAAVEPGQSVRLETSASEGFTQSWYLDGVAAATGLSAEIAAPTTLGRHRIDAVCRDAAEVQAGSVSHSYTVRSQVDPGLLSANFTLVDGEQGVEGLNGARNVAVSPDGESVYVTGYDADSVVVFLRSTTTGLLEYSGRVQGLDGADCLALSPDGAHLYVSAYTDDTVTAFARALDGSLTLLGSSTGLDGARGLAVSPDGAYVYVALSVANAVSVFARDASSGLLTSVSSVTNGSGGLTLLSGPTELALPADGSQLYATAYGSDALLCFSRDTATGALTQAGALCDGVGGVDGLNGAYGLAISPDGGTVLVASYYDDALAVFARDPATGAVTFVAAARDGVGGVDGLAYARDVEVAASGQTVYATGGGDDAVACFRLEGVTHALGYLECVPVGDGPRGLGCSPDSSSLYVCSATADSLGALRASP